MSLAISTISRQSGGFTEDQKSAISREMEKLLASHYFSHSHRFPAFLRFVIGVTLSGRAEELKERTIGIEVFHRNPNYDTSSDPIVRVTAAEIRKRIAQYYQEPLCGTEVQIFLLAGSYIPQFRFQTLADPVVQPEAGIDLTSDGATGLPDPLATTQRHPWRGWASGLAAGTVLCFVAILGWRVARPSPTDFFWGPIFHSRSSVIFCVPNQDDDSHVTLHGAANPSEQIIFSDNLSTVAVSDLDPIVRMARVLESGRKQYGILGADTTNLTILRDGPAVFIGSFDNVWTLRVTSRLRYRFFNDAGWTRSGIIDSQSPNPSRWSVDHNQWVSANGYRDYAIAARFTNPTTGTITIVTAGLTRQGTIAAGQFLTNAGDLAELMQRSRSAGSKPNMEAVISTMVIGGQPGAPTLEAAYFW